MNKPIKTMPEKVTEQLMTYFQDDWQTFFAQGEQMQNTVLEEIITLCQSSAYAQDHGFAQIESLQEFREKVPISEYEDYLPYIAANMKEDRGELIALETKYYLSTTGTTGKIKYFPESYIGALARQLVIDIWNLGSSRLIPQVKDSKIKMLAIINCLPGDFAENGKEIIRASGQAAKVLWERAGELYVYPFRFLEAQMSNDDRDYLTALYTLKEADFSMLYCNNLAYFGVLLDVITQRSKQMIDDIATGQMTAHLTAEDRKALQASFLADPNRAAELQQLLDEYGFLPPEKIWPKFTFIGTWLSGSAGRMAQEVLCRLPDSISCLCEGYGASEAMLTIPMTLNCPYGVIAPFAYYYEFLPLGAKQALSMTEVVDGEFYELVITTYSGLYRYNLHDIVRVHGFTGTTANIEFCCKSTEMCHIQGKIIYGFQLSEMIKQAEEKLGCTLVFYQGFQEANRLSVVIQPFDSSFDKVAFWRYLQESMATYSLIHGKLYVMKPNYRDQLFREQIQKGKVIHSIKLLTITGEPPRTDLVDKIYES